VTLPAGKRLGRYEIRSILGAGGMGEVYLAHDTQLRRAVAIKILPAHFVADQKRLDRFRQEAYAIAALSHPNIAHVYEIDCVDDLNFIVMEFVDGVTLRTRIYRDNVPLNKLIEYLAQAADGLAKAHATGIIHRDLKPDNIMIAHDGYAKILDFGLAKLIPQPSATSSDDLSQVSTELLIHSLPGVLMGTIGYMAPEQVRGQNSEVDHRADIFAFGCILYEAATRHRAFQGDSEIDILHKIVYEDPTDSFSSDTTPDLQRVIRRCLSKDPDKRYQSIKDVAVELRELASSIPSESRGEPRTSETAAAETNKTVTVKAFHKFRTAVLFTGLLVAILATVVYLLWNKRNRSFTATQQRLVSTFPGSHRSATFSPDGLRIAFISDAAGVPQVWTTNLSVGTPRQITFGQERAARPRWSPQGDEIAYVRETGQGAGIWLVKPEGGEPRKIIEGGCNPSWSWDAKRLVFERDYDVWTTNADGSNQTSVEGLPRTDLLLTDRHPAFSPDGSIIAFFQKDKGPLGDIWVIPAQGGQARRLTFDSNFGGTPIWTPDGQFIIFSSLRGGSRTLWRIAASGGQPEPLLVSAGEDTEPAISRDGRQLIYTNTRNNFLLQLTDPAAGKTTTLTESRVDLVNPSFSPKGDKVAFFNVSNDGDIHIFQINVGGNGLTQLTRTKGTRNSHPQWSADGTAIYFYQILPALSFRKLQIGDEQSTELVSGWDWGTQNGARVDPEGKRIIYSKLDRGNVAATMIRDIASGSESAFTMLLDDPRWSPDGKAIIGTKTQSRSMFGDIELCPADGGACRHLTTGGLPHWSQTSRIYFARKSTFPNGEEIWSISPEGKDEVKVTDLHPLHPIGQFFDVSASVQIVWVEYQQGRNELWLAQLP
jgi:eukaryotic-like serine/threonine-protein kinase